MASENKPLAVWHPGVHVFHDEHLHFYFIKVQAFDRVFVVELETLLDRLGIRGRCSYIIFGAYDLLLRVWLTYDKERKLTEALDKDPDVAVLSNFIGFDVDYLWYDKPLIDSDALNKAMSKHAPEELDNVQNGLAAPELIEELRNTGLVLKYQTDNASEKGIKFFSLLTYRGGFQYDQVRKELLKHLDEGHDSIRDLSVYSGTSDVAHFLLKGVADEFHAIAAFVLSLAGKMSVTNMSTHTLLVASPTALDNESDAVEFKRVLLDPAMAAYIEVTLGADCKKKFELLGELDRQVFARKMLEAKEKALFDIDEDKIIKNLFCAKLESDWEEQNREIKRALSYAFAEFERLIVDLFPHILVQEYGGDWRKEQLPRIQGAVGLAEKDISDFTLSDYVSILGYVDKVSRDAPLARQIGLDWQSQLRETIKQRNLTMHGKLKEPAVIWEDIIDLQLVFLPIYYWAREQTKGKGKV